MNNRPSIHQKNKLLRFFLGLFIVLSIFSVSASGNLSSVQTQKAATELPWLTRQNTLKCISSYHLTGSDAIIVKRLHDDLKGLRQQAIFWQDSLLNVKFRAQYQLYTAIKCGILKHFFFATSADRQQEHTTA